MRCLISCGPTYEPLDEVRRLTNFSTGKLGVGLANFLRNAGSEVTLLRASCASAPEFASAKEFTTTERLLARFREEASGNYDALFHAAAVSDFAFGAVYRRSADGKLEKVTSGKFGTRDGNLFAELTPTPKIIGELRTLFPTAVIVGWKYEVEGGRDSAVALGRKQIVENRTNACVVNGAAYGRGFGLVTNSAEVQHCPSADALYDTLLQFVATSLQGR